MEVLLQASARAGATCAGQTPCNSNLTTGQMMSVPLSPRGVGAGPSEAAARAEGARIEGSRIEASGNLPRTGLPGSGLAGNMPSGQFARGSLLLRKALLAPVSDTPPAEPRRLLLRSLWVLIVLVGFPSIVFNVMLPTQASMEAMESQVVLIVSGFVDLVWLILFVYFVSLYRGSWRSEPRFAMVLAVLMLDAFRNVIESCYLGLAYSGHLQLLPAYIDRLLWEPQVSIVSRLLALATAMVILWLVLEGGFHNLQLREQQSLILEQRNRELTALQQLVALVSGTLEKQDVLNRVCREIVDTLAFQSALLCLVDGESGMIRGAAGYGVDPSLIEATQRSLEGRDILADIVRTGATEVISGWDERFHRETFERYGHAGQVRIFAPIQDAQGTVGAVEATVHPAGGTPDSHRLALLHSFLGHACTAIRNARLHERVLADRERLNELSLTLEDKNKQLESFVYMVSHDLKAPIVSIQGFLSLLDSECAAGIGEDGRFYLERVRSNSEHLQRLIQQLLELSRVGRTGDRRDWIDTAGVIAEIAAAMAPRLQEANISLHVTEPLPVIFGEPTQIRQLFTNLVDNAIKYMADSKDRRIEIRGSASPQGAEFVVADTGIGIPAEMHERVFQMFQRLTTRSGDVEGSGVGLAIVRKIAEAHGGRAWVTPNDNGPGSAFHVLLAGAEGSLPEQAYNEFAATEHTAIDHPAG